MHLRRVHPENLAIRHERNPGQWMPIGGVSVSKSPDQSFHRQPGFHHPVLHDVFRIVEIDEAKTPDMEIHSQSHRRQSEANQYARSLLFTEIHAESLTKWPVMKIGIIGCSRHFV